MGWGFPSVGVTQAIAAPVGVCARQHFVQDTPQTLVRK
jgi:hypothetical protein